MPDFSVSLWVAVIAITLVAGFVKGTVGFAMPMIMISGLGSLLPPELALAALMFPTLATNAAQAMRGGGSAALASAKKHWRYIVIVMVMIACSAQLVSILPSWALFLIIGVPVVIFALIQLAGVRFTIPPSGKVYAEFGLGGFSGFVGGMSGVWGPPTVLYLTALDTPKVEQMRVQGIIYGLAAVVLCAAHINSGVLTLATAPLSAVLLIPAMLGIAVGFRMSDALDQVKFRKATLVVLVVAGLNLIRRGIEGF
ncbi:sulfite exporter TauE/SafE family protein [Acuticoccus sp. MNP-M23]|uniref:sulfite exporter TauE/SafE family protein n=1 Tax=Acuticoccus sp. MNP-M23 TaxID=3072793 RepID=UPI0028149B30|nr:sulfite exporter TauE/SafE family protein [Acuticoccus sp. MNP-M23]WMS44060.1 sulfite exporter TauE/SafE family protein [Acuticoccus sp. MNP-M23]